MKKGILIILPILLSSVGLIQALSEDWGYTFFGTKDKVSIYYKVADNTISYKFMNRQDNEIVLHLENLVAIHSRNKEAHTYSSTSFIIKPNKDLYKRLSFDNYSRIERWKVDNWYWEER